jgi:hypothetical protein
VNQEPNHRSGSLIILNPEPDHWFGSKWSGSGSGGIRTMNRTGFFFFFFFFFFQIFIVKCSYTTNK